MCVGGGGEFWYLTRRGELSLQQLCFPQCWQTSVRDGVSLNVYLGAVLDLSLVSDELQVVCKEAERATSTF